MKLYAIGSWVARERGNGKCHLVESVVAGDAVMRCGKRMSDEPTKSGGPLKVTPWSSDLVWSRVPMFCKTCHGSDQPEA